MFVPALIGGCRLAATARDGWAIADIPWHSSIVPVVAIPNFELSTSAARSVLPSEYSRADAIFNTAHLGLMVRGLETGNGEWLTAGLVDRLHQPYRQKLIPGYTDVERAVINAGGYGLVYQRCGADIARFDYRRTCSGCCRCHVSSLGNSRHPSPSSTANDRSSRGCI